MKKLLFFLFLFLSIQAPLQSSEKKEPCKQDPYNFNTFYLKIFLDTKQAHPQENSEYIKKEVLDCFYNLLGDQLALLSAVNLYKSYYEALLKAKEDYKQSLEAVGVKPTTHGLYEMKFSPSFEELSFIMTNRLLFKTQILSTREKIHIQALAIEKGKDPVLKPLITILMKKSEYDEKHNDILALVATILKNAEKIENPRCWTFIEKYTGQNPFNYANSILEIYKEWIASYAKDALSKKEFGDISPELLKTYLQASSMHLVNIEISFKFNVLINEDFSKADYAFLEDFMSVIQEYQKDEKNIACFSDYLKNFLINKGYIKKEEGWSLPSLKDSQEIFLKQQELKKEVVIKQLEEHEKEKRLEQKEQEKKGKKKQSAVTAAPAFLDASWINKNYKVSDKSIVRSIKGDQVIIDDQKNNMLITLIIPDKEILRPTTIPAIKFDERVERWFKNPEKTLHEIGSLTPDEELGKLQAEKLHQKKLEIKRHNFAQMVDP
ncbi:MAG: hypothetical protein AB7R69_02310, partial [Candidatus Babeliales bacterium]